MLVLSCVLLIGLGPLAQVALGVQTELTPAWTADIGKVRDTAVTGVHAYEDLVLVADARGGVSALQAETGELRWFIQLDGPLDHPPMPGKGLAALSSGSELVVVDVATGRRRAQLSLSSPLAASPVCDAERAYLPLLDANRLAALDVATGRDAWDLRLPEGFSGGARLVSGTIVAIPMWDGTLRGVAANGSPSVAQQRWVARIGRVRGTPAQSGAMLYAATARSVVAIGGDSGRVRWEVFPGGKLRSTVVVVDDVVVAQTDSGTVGMARDSGKILWRGESANPLGGLSGAVVLKARDERARIYDAMTGELLNRGLLGRVTVVDPVLIEVRKGGLVAAWRLAR